MPARSYKRRNAAKSGLAGRCQERGEPALVILDLGLEDKALRQAVIDIMMIDASVHTAVVSDMEPEAFHEATEGLGILMPLPSSPTAADAQRLLTALAGVM